MFEMQKLPGFADAKALMPKNDHDLQIAITLLVMQAYGQGQLDGIKQGIAIAAAERVPFRNSPAIHLSRDGTDSANTDDII